MWVWRQSSLRICSPLFLEDSHCIFTLNAHVVPVYKEGLQSLWQMYNTELVENYAAWLSRHKSSYWNNFDKII